MDFVVTLIIGGIVGWLASILMGANAQMGILANVIVGVVGALLGHAAANAMGLTTGGALAGWVVAILGAVLLIALLRALGFFRPRARVR
jgi:uncharacterized membrane protein YeaQ/YmgE (transglycosylase-associated protein family)